MILKNYLLYKENVIDSSFFLNGIECFDLNDNTSSYYNLLPSDKEIVITGKLDCNREDVLYYLMKLEDILQLKKLKKILGYGMVKKLVLIKFK